MLTDTVARGPWEDCYELGKLATFLMELQEKFLNSDLGSEVFSHDYIARYVNFVNCANRLHLNITIADPITGIETMEKGALVRRVRMIAEEVALQIHSIFSYVVERCFKLGQIIARIRILGTLFTPGDILVLTRLNEQMSELNRMRDYLQGLGVEESRVVGLVSMLERHTHNLIVDARPFFNQWDDLAQGLEEQLFAGIRRSLGSRVDVRSVSLVGSGANVANVVVHGDVVVAGEYNAAEGTTRELSSRFFGGVREHLPEDTPHPR